MCVRVRVCVRLDMTGAQDGSVRMFEWNRPQQLICFRQAGNARVTRLYFNSQGNKVWHPGALHALCHALSLHCGSLKMANLVLINALLSKFLSAK